VHYDPPPYHGPCDRTGLVRLAPRLRRPGHRADRRLRRDDAADLVLGGTPGPLEKGPACSPSAAITPVPVLFGICLIYGTGHGARRPPRLTANPGPGALDGLGAVQQRLAAQPVGDAPGFLHRGRRALGVTQPREVLGIVEQAMREVIGRAQLT